MLVLATPTRLMTFQHCYILDLFHVSDTDYAYFLSLTYLFHQHRHLLQPTFIIITCLKCYFS